MNKRIDDGLKRYILEEFAEIYKGITTSIVDKETGELIWAIWQAYSGRTDRWRGCGACLAGKVKFLKKQCKEFGIEI